MKKTRLKLVIAFLATAGLLTAVQAQEPHSAKIVQCAGLQPAEVAAQVKRDFLQNRIPRWKADKKLLGTTTPIAWISPQAISGKDQVWQVSLTVRGTQQDKTYNVTLNCRSGDISYSDPQ